MEPFGTEALVLTEVGTSAFLKHTTKETVVNPAVAGAMAVAGRSNYSQETKLSQRDPEQPGKLWVTKDL